MIRARVSPWVLHSCPRSFHIVASMVHVMLVHVSLSTSHNFIVSLADPKLDKSMLGFTYSPGSQIALCFESLAQKVQESFPLSYSKRFEAILFDCGGTLKCGICFVCGTSKGHDRGLCWSDLCREQGMESDKDTNDEEGEEESPDVDDKKD